MRLTKYMGIFGAGLGFATGCILRDEMNYSSYEKLDDILNNYERNSQKIKNDRANITKKINEKRRELEEILKKEAQENKNTKNNI